MPFAYPIRLILLLLACFAGTAWAEQAQFLPDRDAALYEDTEGDLANGSGRYLFFGKVGTNPGGDELLRRSLLRFDLTAIPPEAVIEAVSLSFVINMVPQGNPPGGTATLHRMTADWGEGSSNAPGNEGQGISAELGDATWLHRNYPSSLWTTPGGDFVEEASASAGYTASLPETVTFASTPGLIADVTDWVRDPTKNHGWILRGGESLAFTARRTSSREDASADTPVLTVDFFIPSPTDNLVLTELVDGLTRPVVIANAPDGRGRLFIVEQRGVVRIFDVTAETLLPTPYLDISSLVDDGGNEQGLLGLAFHPGFADNRRFFVYYTRDPGPGADRSVVAEFTQNAQDPNVANGAANQDDVMVVLEFEQDASNHNGGDLHFGPDGFLYIASGDGGGSNDQFNNAQNEDSLKGKLLRIDVDGSPGQGAELCGLVTNYGIPAGNAFPGGADGCDETLHLGLRNPWKFSFDAFTGDLYLGDVGQGEREEIDRAVAGSGGLNFGWPCFEGTEPFRNDVSCTDPVPPVIEYSSASGTSECSVTGGYVYRGGLTALERFYVFGDYCSGRIWISDVRDGQWNVEEWTDAEAQLSGLSAFGQDEQCRLYVAEFGGIAGAQNVDGLGRILRIDDSELLLADGFERRDCQ
jgi:glucose/arabinose dehydrogenase